MKNANQFVDEAWRSGKIEYDAAADMDLSELLNPLIDAIFGEDTKKHRRYEVLVQFIKATRPVVDVLIDQQMEWHEIDSGLREASLKKRASDLELRYDELCVLASSLSDQKLALIEREDAVRERETAVAEREKQVAIELERLQAIKNNLARFFNDKAGS